MAEGKDDVVKRLVEGVSLLQMRELGVHALRAWKRRRPQKNSWQAHGDLAYELIPLLEQRRPNDLAGHHRDQLKEIFIAYANEPWLSPFAEFVWWTVRAGISIPLSSGNDNIPAPRSERRSFRDSPGLPVCRPTTPSAQRWRTHAANVRHG